MGFNLWAPWGRCNGSFLVRRMAPGHLKRGQYSPKLCGNSCLFVCLLIHSLDKGKKKSIIIGDREDAASQESIGI